MIGWAQIGYGAALSAALAVLLLLAVRCREPAVLATGALAAAAGPAASNAILHATHGREFFTDAPVAVFPISWQDTGSAVFTLATAALALGLGPLAAQPARITIRYALVTALAALLTDVYLY